MELSFGSAGAGWPNRCGAAGTLQPAVWQVPVLGEAEGRAPGLMFPAFTAVSFFLFGVCYCGGDLSVLV